MSKPGPRCVVFTEYAQDGTARLYLIDPVTGRKAPVSGPLRPSDVERRVRQVGRQSERSGNRVEYAEG